MFDKVDQLAVNSIRTLSMDAIQKANSGHPGLPLGAAPMAYTLWSRFLNVNPSNTTWSNRDRFVLSAGHGSMLLYSLLHLSGFKLSIEDLKNFRQWDSLTPGHPEFGHTDGVEATTGPLGQGIGMAVGFAMAERHLAGMYNKDKFNVVDHYTYALCGDGDLMEGVSAEAVSMAGHEQLDKLIVLYDSNDISLDGDLDRSFSESVQKRFDSYNWQHLLVKDGNDLAEIEAAIAEAKANTTQPTIIEIKTVIGFGSPKQGTSAVHGAPLGSEGISETKAAYGWDLPDFTVPEEVYARYQANVADRGAKAEAEWNALFASYKAEYPELAQQFVDSFEGKLPAGWDADLPSFDEGSSTASRASSGEVINAIADKVPFFFGGSADLAGSNNTTIKSDGQFTVDAPEQRNIWFGVREFAMATALNGMSLHGGLRVYGGTFFVFSDYLKAAARLAAIQHQPVTYVLTHDSVAVGEDGPTHEPVEQLASLRSIPNMVVIRPADGNEVKAAWTIALESQDHPTALVLSRQNLPVVAGSASKAADGVRKGGYVISPSTKDVADAILIATGSEVNLAVQAQAALAAKGTDVSVVSIPSFNLFDKQSAEYKESVLPNAVRKRVGIEMGSSFGWGKYVGLDGTVIAIDTFGASAPGEKIIEEYGFTVDNVVKAVESL
ncbi:transketolase [Brochothrix thermosphacta]|uniref:Transketolase n=1 Tax=Brochothrix thermosphacta TaxID=2756 RepID=A0A2X0QCY3_BROTH|nr:transketolase [Brochothrix thermosphacta]ANZ93988.1 transketolase [Brochothrix thermosphacta]MDO7863089.1 transketolase [Brochothrix thermosphacta]ODJ60095.1 transketolase [Brochothrix thermosphacta]ODJ65222.1 transketolase [Brochothrix thermosphacta]WKK70117.1 transketolase [Brochothrix thermosphacta]